MNVTTEGPTQLRASWVHAPGARDGYQVTLYQAGAQASASTVGAEVDSTSFSALTPGTQYEVEIMSQAGPLGTAAANVSGWTCESRLGKAMRGGEVGRAASETPGFFS